jgi:uncharacterized membrane protein YphA (DoxX/SURF4 family)
MHGGWTPMHVIDLALRLLLAAVLLTAGVAKLRDLDGSRKAVAGFGIPARFAGIIGSLLPFAELLAAVALLIPASAWWGAILAAVLLASFGLAIAISLTRGKAPECNCFGQLHSAPVGRSTLARNTVLIGLAVVVIATRTDAAQLSPVGWVTELTTAEIALLALGVVLAVVSLGEGWFLLQLLHQNGRILTRLENLEAGSGSAAATGATHAGNRNGNGRVPGLAVGAPAPGFTLQIAGIACTCRE